MDQQLEELGMIMLTLAIPLIIRFAFDLYRKRKQPKLPDLKREPRPLSYNDKLSSCFFLLCCILHVYILFHTPHSFLKTIGASVNSPSFIVRNQFRDYMMNRFPGWTKTMGLYETESPAKHIFDEITFETQIKPLEDLYDKLRASKWRKLYGR